MRLSELSYYDHMVAIFLHHKEAFDASICESCGGTGFEPVLCCQGQDCTCQGSPVEFKEECSACHRKGPEYLLTTKERRSIATGLTCHHRSGSVYEDDGGAFRKCDKNGKECLVLGRCPEC